MSIGVYLVFTIWEIETQKFFIDLFLSNNNKENKEEKKRII